MSDQTRSDVSENADAATIDAVAAVIAKAVSDYIARDLAEDLVAALAEAGWLRTAEDRAVLDAAEAETDAEDYLSQGIQSVAANPGHTHVDKAFVANLRKDRDDANAARRGAVRARRVAAGGTEEQT